MIVEWEAFFMKWVEGAVSQAGSEGGIQTMEERIGNKILGSKISGSYPKFTLKFFLSLF